MASKKFSELPPRQQGLVLAVMPVILAVVVFYDVVSPIKTKATGLKAQLTTLQNQNARGRILETQHAELVRRIAEAQKELAALQQIVPDQPANGQLIEMINDVAGEAHVHVRSLVAEAPVRQQYFTAEPFRVRVDGTYYAMLDFFSRLAGSPRIVNVSSLTLGPPGGSGGSGGYKIGPEETVGANCVVTTFYNSPPLPPPSLGRPVRR